MRSTSSLRNAGFCSTSASSSMALGSASLSVFSRTRLVSLPEPAASSMACSSSSAASWVVVRERVPSVTMLETNPARPALAGGSPFTPVPKRMSMETMGTAWSSLTNTRAPFLSLRSTGTGASNRSCPGSGGGFWARKGASGGSGKRGGPDCVVSPGCDPGLGAGAGLACSAWPAASAARRSPARSVFVIAVSSRRSRGLFTGRHGGELQPPVVRKVLAGEGLDRLRRHRPIPGQIAREIAGILEPRLVSVEEVRPRAGALHRSDLAGDDLELGALHFVRADALLLHLVDRLLQERAQLRRGVARPGRRAHLDPSAQAQRGVVRVDAAGHLLVQDEQLVQARSLATGEDLAEHVPGGLVVVEGLEAVPDHLEAGKLGEPILQRLLHHRRDGRGLDVRLLDLRPAGDVGEVLLDQTLGSRRIEVPDQHQRGVVRPVIAAEEVAHVVERGSLDLLDASDGALEVRMRQGVQKVAHALLRGTVGDVVDPLVALVAHHVALDLELLLVERREQESHPIAPQPERGGQLVGGDGLVIVGAIEAGRAVHPRSPDLLQDGV